MAGIQVGSGQVAEKAKMRNKDGSMRKIRCLDCGKMTDNPAVGLIRTVSKKWLCFGCGEIHGYRHMCDKCGNYDKVKMQACPLNGDNGTCKKCLGKKCVHCAGNAWGWKDGNGLMCDLEYTGGSPAYIAYLAKECLVVWSEQELKMASP